MYVTTGVALQGAHVAAFPNVYKGVAAGFGVHDCPSVPGVPHGRVEGIQLSISSPSVTESTSTVNVVPIYDIIIPFINQDG